MRLALSTFFLIFPLILVGQEDDPGKLKRVEEIGTWSSAVGTWEGKYYVKAAPEVLYQQLEKIGATDSGFGIRVTLREDKASVFLQYEPGGEWSAIASDSHIIPDKLAWHIFMASEGGVWLERYVLSFMRIEEEVADFVITRTVHNWYDSGAEEAPTTFYVFGAGQVTRTMDAE